MARYVTCSRAQREERERREREAERLRLERSRARRERQSERNRRATRSQAGEPGPSRAARRQSSDDDDDEPLNPDFIERVQAFNRDEEDKDRFFIVEALLDKRYDLKGEEEYLVRWLNYPPEFDTWEPRAELEQNSLAMINEFNNVDHLNTSDQELHCICQRPYKARDGGMIQCFTCSGWYHFTCLEMNMFEANSYARWHCDKCRATHNLKNAIKREKVDALFGNTRLVDIENQNQVIISEDGQFLVG